jgi:hypothetical protein
MASQAELKSEAERDKGKARIPERRQMGVAGLLGTFGASKRCYLLYPSPSALLGEVHPRWRTKQSKSALVEGLFRW